MSYPVAQQQIFDRLDAVPHTDTHRGQVSDEYISELIANTDQFQPFYVVSFGGRVDPRRNVNGIAGARLNTHMVTFILHAIASTQKNADLVLEEGWNTLIGFEPTNCGEITAALFGGTGEISVAGSPSRYSAVQSFKMYVNSTLFE
jgi:hypothetical protein